MIKDKQKIRIKNKNDSLSGSVKNALFYWHKFGLTKFNYSQLDPIVVLLDKLYSFVDLDPVIVAEEEREKMYKMLEDVALNTESAILMFESQNNNLVQVPIDSETDGPKTILLKPVTGAIKVNYQ